MQIACLLTVAAALVAVTGALGRTVNPAHRTTREGLTGRRLRHRADLKPRLSRGTGR